VQLGGGGHRDGREPAGMPVEGIRDVIVGAVEGHEHGGRHARGGHAGEQVLDRRVAVRRGQGVDAAGRDRGRTEDVRVGVDRAGTPPSAGVTVWSG
jgi:hypothetical protein